MARPLPITVILGGDSFQVSLLSLGDVENIEGFLFDPVLARKPTALGKCVVGLAIKASSPNFDIEAQPGTVHELSAAMKSILGFAGFLQASDQGEAPAAALNASTGDGSEAA